MTSRPDDERYPPSLRDAAEQVLGRPRVFGRHDVSAAAGVPFEEARQFWLALGFPAAADDETPFTHADVDALRQIVDLVRDGRLDPPLALSMTRAIGRSADRLAAWQASLLLDVALTERGAPDEQVHDLEARMEGPRGSGAAGGSSDDTQAALLAGERLLALADELEPLVVYAWRRHLAAALSRLFSEGHGETGVHRTVGFADMVGFTTLVTRLSDQQLARLVARFEALAADVAATHRGRIVKTVGDEVFYDAGSAGAGVEIAIDLLRAMEGDASMPRLRVGVASGATLSHLGDLFGTTVNRASRITEIARPGAVVVDEATAEALADDPAYVLGRLEPRPLRGLGVTGMWTVERADRSPVD